MDTIIDGDWAKVEALAMKMEGVVSEARQIRARIAKLKEALGE